MKKTLGILLILFTVQLQSQIVSDSEKKRKTHLVPAPTGNKTDDRESIMDILNKAIEGDTIQFSSGTYEIGEKIKLLIDGLTLIGSTDGTIIRGCQPEDFKERIHALLNCGGFELVGGNITIDNFIIENTWHGLFVGCCFPENMEELRSDLSIKREHSGGHIIQNNTFRFNETGMRVIGVNPKTVIVRNNVFQDNFHGLTINGANVTVEKNKFFALTPDKVPLSNEVNNAIGILPFSSMFKPENALNIKEDCSNIIIKENTIEKFPESVVITQKDICSGIILKDNIIKH